MSHLLLFTDHHHYFLYAEPVNMNKSFSGLEGVIKKNLKRQMNEKDIYVFLNKSLTHIKIFCYTTRKFTLIYEKLHKGTFKITARSKNGVIQLSANELLLLVRGLQMRERKNEGRLSTTYTAVE